MSGEEQASETPVCDLHMGPCEWKMIGAPWVAELEKGEVGSQGQEYHLSLHTSSNPERFLAVLKGESMYLGEYPVPLKRTKTEAGIDVWRATFTAPFCTTDPDMLWRIDLKQGNTMVSDIPVKLVFQAEGR